MLPNENNNAVVCLYTVAFYFQLKDITSSRLGCLFGKFHLLTFTTKFRSDLNRNLLALCSYVMHGILCVFLFLNNSSFSFEKETDTVDMISINRNMFELIFKIIAVKFLSRNIGYDIAKSKLRYIFLLKWSLLSFNVFLCVFSVTVVLLNFVQPVSEPSYTPSSIIIWSVIRYRVCLSDCC